MGTVYRVYDEVLNREAALKTLNGDLSQEYMVNFQREAKVASTLDDRHIVKILDFGVENSQTPYMVMELIEGEILRELLTRRRLKTEEALVLLIEICQGVEAAHHAGIVHRDLKPANVIIEHPDSEQASVKLLDFGIAKVTARDQGISTLSNAGVVVGSPFYMSPEQARAESIDQRTDIYSLGCMAFEMLTGKRPFEGATAFDTLNLHINENAPPLSQADPERSYTPQLEQTIEAALAKDPEDRLPSMEALRQKLIESLEAESLAAVEITGDNSPVKGSPARSPAAVWLGALAILALLTASGAFFLFRAPPASEPAKVATIEERGDDTELLSGMADVEKHNSYLQVEGERAEQTIAELATTEHQYRSLAVFNARITPAMIDNLTVVGPRKLAFTNCILDDEILEKVSKIKSIDRFSLLGATEITEKGLKALADLPKLYLLRLERCNLDNDKIRAVRYMKHLVRLEMADNRKVTVTGIKSIGKRRQTLLISAPGCACATQVGYAGEELEKDYNIKLDARDTAF
ncbi:MAG: serine/threonine protein kinase [Cyanobacteria bacterium HKST-UBA02]|nr:serine/threonine protein kinase [Cyanobacteria bacterium HKST-UBA02]